jgi:hypothetical protein
MNVIVHVTIEESLYYYGAEQNILLEEDIKIPTTLYRWNYRSDEYVIFETKLINILTKAMIQYKNIDEFLIRVKCEFEDLRRQAGHVSATRIIRTKTKTQISHDIKNLKYLCEHVYCTLGAKANSTLSDLQTELLNAPKDMPIYSHVIYTIDQLR